MQDSVPSWFGPRASTPSTSTVVVGLRPGMTGADTRRSTPGQNGWRYDAPDNRILVEAVSHQTAASHHYAWEDLTTRLMEANIFLDPRFVLPAVQHFPLARRPAFVLVWDENEGERHRLIGLCPVLLPSSRFSRTASVWQHKQAALGTPLIDRGRAIEALDLILDWLHREYPGMAGLILPKLRFDGPVMALLRNRAILTGRQIELFDQHERAMLPGGLAGAAAMKHSLSAKKHKELRRQRRRLEGNGTLTFRMARKPNEVRDAVEHFLALEAKGWKGGRGTALLADPALTTFTRTMTRLLARDGKCRVCTLELQGKPVASGILLASGGFAYVWKIAYDENYAQYSPGVQFVLDLTTMLIGEENVIFTDSCAIPHHPMIDRIWRERIAMADVMMGVAPARTWKFARSAWIEAARRMLRARLKAIFHKITGRKAS